MVYNIDKDEQINFIKWIKKNVNVDMFRGENRKINIIMTFRHEKKLLLFFKKKKKKKKRLEKGED